MARELRMGSAVREVLERWFNPIWEVTDERQIQSKQIVEQQQPLAQPHRQPQRVQQSRRQPHAQPHRRPFHPIQLWK